MGGGYRCAGHFVMLGLNPVPCLSLLCDREAQFL